MIWSVNPPLHASLVLPALSDETEESNDKSAICVALSSCCQRPKLLQKKIEPVPQDRERLFHCTSQSKTGGRKSRKWDIHTVQKLQRTSGEAYTATKAAFFQPLYLSLE